MRDKDNKFTSVSIPTFLFDRIKARLPESGFTSVGSYVAYVLRDILADKREGEPLTKDDQEKIKERLRVLGYID